MANLTGDFKYANFRSESELRAGVLLWVIVSPILLVFGTIGNVLSIVILSRKKFNKSPATLYLTALSAADLTMLYVGLPRQWIRYLTGVDFRLSSNVMCKVHWWLMYTSADVCVWLLTTVTVERVISSLCPYKSKVFCTRKRALFIIAFVIFAAFLINSHLLYGFGRLTIQDGNDSIILPCVPLTDEYAKFFGLVWTWIDLCKFSLAPFLILTLGNICIIWKVISSGKKSATNGIPLPQQGHANKTSAMSRLLIALNFVFIGCTSPVCIYFIGEPYWIPEDIPRDIKLQDPAWAFVNLMMYTNNSVNFILYCFSGSKFRGELKALFSFSNRITPSSAPATIGTVASRSIGRTL